MNFAKLFLMAIVLVIVSTASAAAQTTPGSIMSLRCDQQHDGRLLVGGSFAPDPYRVGPFGTIKVEGATIGSAPADQVFSYIWDVGVAQSYRATLTSYPGGECRVTDCSLLMKSSAPDRSGDVATPQLAPTRDLSLERLRLASLGYVARVATGLHPPGLRGATLSLESDPLEVLSEARLVLLASEPRPRGVGFVLQFANTGELLNMAHVAFPQGMYRGQKSQLPVSDFRQGSGRILFVFIAEDWQTFGNEPASVSLLANYPLFAVQPTGGGIEVVQRTRCAEPEEGYEYILKAKENVPTVVVDGVTIREFWIVQLADENGRQIIFLPIRVMQRPHGAGLARVVEVTFCTPAGECTSDSLTPRVKAYTTQMTNNTPPE